ncbi:carboxypeptidase-like regulatory domain-containing protein [Engelhardtia mirabilis]|uniref:Dioxygenase n=1 Tax=Engelhardtia mirabilis TaxID=2528011 RepID=A0A518BM81_9BACT|nr:Dioxygenase [Planctomycetes bacterium Pla133]QDV02410.1 Dioxygenase [Planctomycetes bacterium Pla86]
MFTTRNPWALRPPVRRRGNALTVLVLVFGALALLAAVGWFLLGARSSTAVSPAGGGAAPSAPVSAAGPRADTTLRAVGEESAEGRSVDNRAVVSTELAPTVSPTEPEAQASSGRLVGRIVDDLGSPVADAELVIRGNAFAMGQEPREASSGADGRFEIDGLGGRVWTLEVGAQGHAPVRRTDLAVPAGGRLDLGDVTSARGAILSGRVIDAGGAGVAGARIFPLSKDWFTIGALLDREPLAITDGGGAFVVDRIEGGAWALVVNSELHPPAMFEGDSAGPGSTTSGLEFQLSSGATISGQIVGLPAGLAGDLVVQARSVDQEQLGHSRELAPAADGSFALPGLVPDAVYRVQVRESAKVRSDRSRDFRFGYAEPRSQAVIARGGDGGLILEYSVGSSVSFRVVDDNTGQPIEDFEAKASGQFIYETAQGPDSERPNHHPGGLARIENMSANAGAAGVQPTLSIEAVGYEILKLELGVLQPGQGRDLGDLRLESAEVMLVRVVDGRDGQPIEGARVNVSPWSPPQPEGATRSMSLSISVDDSGATQSIDWGGERRSAVTDADGIARLTALEGQVELTVTADGFARLNQKPVELESGGEAYEVALDEGGAVRVLVVDEAGTPLPGARVEHRSPSDGGFEGMRIIGGSFGGGGEVSDAEGQIAFQNLEPGEHRFRINTSRSTGGGLGNFVFASVDESAPDESWIVVSVVAGEVADLTLVSPTLTVLRGRISESGSPLIGATVSLSKAGDASSPMLRLPGMGGPSARTDADGRYEIEGIQPGEYEIEVTHATRAMPYTLETELSDPQERLDLDLPLTVVAGRIVDKHGEPMAGVVVEAKEVQQATGGPQVVGSMRAVSLVTFDSGGGSGGMVTFGGPDQAVSVRTDADGKYELRGVAADRPIRVEAKPELGEEGESDVFEVPAGERRDGVDIEIAPAGAIALDLVDSDGRPFGVCMVAARWQGNEDDAPEPRREFVSESGELLLVGLRPGTWELSVSSFGPDGASNTVASQSVEVEAEVRQPVTLTIP